MGDELFDQNAAEITEITEAAGAAADEVVEVTGNYGVPEDVQAQTFTENAGQAPVYEAPAYENVDARAEFGKIIYDEFHGKDVTPDPEPEPSPVPTPSDEKLCKAIDLLRQALELLKEIALNS